MTIHGVRANGSKDSVLAVMNKFNPQDSVLFVERLAAIW